MSPFTPTWLYIKQHNLTGLKYFGRTTCSDPKKYKGSGTHWKRHIKENGNNVTTVWAQLFTEKEVLREYALSFSANNNIVASTEWANLVTEDGVNGSVKGRIVSDETRQKMSAAKKGKSTGPLSEEAKMKISKANKGKSKPPFSMAHREKIGKFQKGRTASDETKQKMSNWHTGKTVSESTRQKISLIHKGKTVSLETRQKLSTALSGLTRSDEIKEKMVALGKEKRWWTNGIHQTLSKICPSGWWRGRIK